MKKYVVTIGRQFGSLGRPIARKTAELLGVDYYDRDIVEEVARRMDMPLQIVSKKEEEANHRFGAFGKMIYPLGTGTTELQDRIFSVQECVIRDFAEKSSCVLVGRCADYVMRDYVNILRVFIYAPFADRMRTCVAVMNMDTDSARKICTQVDKARLAYHRHYAGYLPNDPEHLDLAINSSLLGVDGTAQLLAEAVCRRFGG